MLTHRHGEQIGRPQASTKFNESPWKMPENSCKSMFHCKACLKIRKKIASFTSAVPFCLQKGIFKGEGLSPSHKTPSSIMAHYTDKVPTASPHHPPARPLVASLFEISCRRKRIPEKSFPLEASNETSTNFPQARNVSFQWTCTFLPQPISSLNLLLEPLSD